MNAEEIVVELRKRGWSKAELARKSGLRYQAVSEITLLYRPARRREVAAIRKAFEESLGEACGEVQP